MTLRMDPGDIVTCKLNAHRSAWDGTICQFPTEWNCGAKEEFRASKCDRGHPRCFHLNVFNESNPRFQADRNGMDWVLRGNPSQLDDQLLLFWTEATGERTGVKTPQRRIAVGIYRVDTSQRPESIYTWEILPHSGGWCRFPAIELDCPASTYAGGNYVRVMEGRLLRRLFARIKNEADTGVDWYAPGDEARFRAFHANLDNYLEVAKAKRETFRPAPVAKQTFSFGTDATTGTGSLADQFQQLEKSLTYKTEEPPAAAPTSPAASSGVEMPAAAPAPSPAPETEPAPTAASEARDSTATPHPLLSESKRLWLSELYGEVVARSVSIASATKTFMILRGPTGAGKSFLARNLVPSERFILVPVGATWRGREDLLGYTNPVSGAFEATPFTRFLERASRTWGAGSCEPWLVVFDEFNLSQPEHWLTDILSVSQAPEEDQRIIELGGSGFLPDGEDEPVERVFLSPAVRFIATINNDHTVLPLSPRVLDRSSLVDLPLEPHAAIRRVGLEIGADLVDAITDLDYELRSRGTTFSIRTAQSLELALAQREALDLDEWAILDHVLCQEVLSKLRLHAGDTSDLALLESLRSWQGNHGSNLVRCAERLDIWGDQLERGMDVIQA